MIFEKPEDLEREKNAIEKFVNVFKGSYKKLDPYDIDFKIFNEDKKHIAFVEVKGRNKDMSNAYPLPISLEKVAKLMAKKMVSVVIWACNDGIIYAQVKDLIGEVKWGGRPPREGAVNDEELMIYYAKQKSFKYIKFNETNF
jgi:hypothetical protein